MWHCYVLACADGTLYTGITTALGRRLVQHNRGVGAKYTRGRGPVTLAYAEGYATRARAARREYEIKTMSRGEKLALVNGRRRPPRSRGRSRPRARRG
jgi:putative endonuclease